MSPFLRSYILVICLASLSSALAVEEEKGKKSVKVPNASHCSRTTRKNSGLCEENFFCYPQLLKINISYNTALSGDFFPVKVFFHTSDNVNTKSVIINMRSASLPENLIETDENFRKVKNGNYEKKALPDHWYMPADTYQIFDKTECYEKKWVNLLNAMEPAFTLEKLGIKEGGEVIYHFPMAVIFQLTEPDTLQYYTTFIAANNKTCTRKLNVKNKNNHYKLGIGSFK